MASHEHVISIAILTSPRHICSMKPVIITNNPVTISYAEAILKDADIESFVLDQNMSVLEPGILIPKRLMVIDEDEAEARNALVSAGLEAELTG